MDDQILIKFGNCDIQIEFAKVNSILISKSINLVIYYNFVRCWGPLWSKAIFCAQSIYRDVCDSHITI